MKHLWITKARIRLGLSQDLLWLNTGIDQRRISRFEIGETEPSKEEVQTLKAFFKNRKGHINKVRLLRKAARLTQQQLADATGINYVNISRAERGIIKLTKGEIERIKEVLK